MLPLVVEVEVDGPDAGAEFDVADVDLVDFDLVAIADLVADVLNDDVDVFGSSSSEPERVLFEKDQYCSSWYSQLFYVVPGQANQQSYEW